MGFLRTSSLTQGFWVLAFGASQQPSYLSKELRQHCTLRLHPGVRIPASAGSSFQKSKLKACRESWHLGQMWLIIFSNLSLLFLVFMPLIFMFQLPNSSKSSLQSPLSSVLCRWSSNILVWKSDYFSLLGERKGRSQGPMSRNLTLLLVAHTILKTVNISSTTAQLQNCFVFLGRNTVLCARACSALDNRSTFSSGDKRAFAGAALNNYSPPEEQALSSCSLNLSLSSSSPSSSFFLDAHLSI